MCKQVDDAVLNFKGMVDSFCKSGIILKIPDLQRNYVWGTIQWQQLWCDILNVWKKCKNIENEDSVKLLWVL